MALIIESNSQCLVVVNEGFAVGHMDSDCDDVVVQCLEFLCVSACLLLSMPIDIYCIKLLNIF